MTEIDHSDKFPKVPPFIIEEQKPIPADQDVILDILLSPDEPVANPPTSDKTKFPAKITQESSIGDIFKKNRELKKARRPKPKRF